MEMKKSKLTYVLVSLSIVIGLVAGFFGIKYPTPPMPEPLPSMPESRALADRYFESLIVGKELVSDGTLDVTGATALDGGLTMDTNKFTVADTTGNTTIAGTLSVTGASALTGAVNAAADVDVGTWVNLSAQSAVVVTAGSIITPTGTYQVITSTAAVTTSTSTAIADGSEIGDLLILRNANASDAITVDGTGGNVECKADVALGAGDTLMLIWNGSDWNCLSNYDNS